MIYIVSEINKSVFESMNDRYFAYKRYFTYKSLADAMKCKDDLISFWIHDACEIEDCLVEELEDNGFEIVHDEPFLYQFLYNEQEVKIQLKAINLE